MVSYDSTVLCLVSYPCVMKLEKRNLGSNLPLTFYDVLPALGQQPVLMHLGVRRFWHQSLYHST